MSKVRILMISMPSIHVVNWLRHLGSSTHEVAWFDVTGRGTLNTDYPVRQYRNWQRRKVPYIRGEYWASKNLPGAFEKIRPFLEVTENEALVEIIKEFKPDIVHSFEMQSCSYPIFATLKEYSNLRWIYSCWGNDLYYYRNFKIHEKKIRKILERIDMLHTDNYRDISLAKKLSYRGGFTGVIPGGGGLNIDEIKFYIQPLSKRRKILIKGYEHTFGRGLNVVKAIEEIFTRMPSELEVVVFGSHPKVSEYIKNRGLPFTVYSRHALLRNDILKLLGQSMVYVGNSISDGIPNTLLEAMVMGAFPIQSNPGGVTEELINDGVNGLLINNPEDIGEIREVILKALGAAEMRANAHFMNITCISQRLSEEVISHKIAQIYK